jgi:hypothetical protein
MINKRGSLGLTIVFIIFFWVIGFASINFIMDEVTNTTAQLNCDSATTISAGTMFLCLMLDTTVIYFIMTIMSIIIGSITSRLIL